MQSESMRTLDGSKIQTIAVNTTGYLSDIIVCSVCRNTSVDTATRYRLDGSGFEIRLGKLFLKPSRRSLGPTQPTVQLVPCLNKEDKAAGA